MEAMDHARCSELLPAYDRGELDAPEAAAVASHLDGCVDCSLELAGVRALHMAPAEPMSAAERAGVHSAIATAIAEPDRQEVVAPAPRRRFWARVAPALGGVAVLAIVLVGIAMNLGGTSDDRSFDGGDGGSGAGGAATESEDAATLEGAQSAPAPDVANEELAYFAGDIGAVSQRDLRRAAKSRRVETADGSARTIATDGAAAFSGFDTDESRTRYLSALKGQADEPTGQQIEECSRTVTEGFDFPSVPTYAALARLGGQRVLILGFSWGENEGGRLNRFMLWAWPIGDCRVPVFYGSGTPPN